MSILEQFKHERSVLSLKLYGVSAAFSGNPDAAISSKTFVEFLTALNGVIGLQQRMIDAMAEKQDQATGEAAADEVPPGAAGKHSPTPGPGLGLEHNPMWQVCVPFDHNQLKRLYSMLLEDGDEDMHDLRVALRHVSIKEARKFALILCEVMG